MQPLRQVFPAFVGASLMALAGCNNIVTNQYDATATATYHWQVQYSTDPASPQTRRLEQFSEASLINHNGLKPEAAVTGPDDQGIWWPALPPRPTVDQIEARQKSLEKASTPELVKTVEYQLNYRVGNQNWTLPTNYQVYRQVVKAHPSNTPLALTLAPGNTSVLKAEPQ